MGVATRFILLDLYDTLAWVDFPGLEAGRAAMAARLGVTSDAYYQAWKETLTARMLGRFGGGRGDVGAVLAALGVSGSAALEADIAEGEEVLWRQVVSLFDDVEPCLIELRRRGLRLTLVSNCAYQTRAVVDSWQLGRHLDAVVLSWEVGLVKPDPAIYLHALKLLGGQPEAALLVDDSEEFLEAASRLGIQTRLMCRGSQAAGTAHRQLAGLGELVEL